MCDQGLPEAGGARYEPPSIAPALEAVIAEAEGSAKTRREVSRFMGPQRTLDS